MSTGKPTKLILDKDFKLAGTAKDKKDITLVHKDKNHRVKKELSFQAGKKKSKLA
ncbi:hypothetical protein SAMN04488009_0560 [Maribacter sedimenticola]|uniref:Uncharacterized protein n=1 Tax=Maribacter sedimenticola TaxID=228956 RepID=A0ABY1SCQ7_9FLAO|nr:hypothetical protein [Maribacter sedimenticola]SNR26837.1 hypothetical protein SAMN04488009_0560 [Maribacter sedimenticola]